MGVNVTVFNQEDVDPLGALRRLAEKHPRPVPSLTTEGWDQLGHVALTDIGSIADVDRFVLEHLRPYEAWAASEELLLTVTCAPDGVATLDQRIGLAHLPGPWHALDALRPMPLCASANLHRARTRREELPWPLPPSWVATNRLEEAVRRDLRCSDCIDWIHA